MIISIIINGVREGGHKDEEYKVYFGVVFSRGGRLTSAIWGKFIEKRIRG